MSDHLSLLCELDPEHFSGSGGHKWWRKTSEEKFLLLIDGITWEIAGWMLTQMQERSQVCQDEFIVHGTQSPEFEYLEEFLTRHLRFITPDHITLSYTRWREIQQRSDAPAASGQELRPQAPANTHETDH